MLPVTSRCRPSVAHLGLVAAALAGTISVPGCKAITGASSKAPASLVVVEGASQSGQVGRDLATPIVLRVLDSAGDGVHGVTVTLAVSAGGGIVTPSSDTTDASGQFTAKWTLGPTAVAQQIMAATPGVLSVPINATGLLPTQIVLVQGDNQTAKSGSALSNSIIVRVVSGANIPMQGVTVGFQVTAGGGGMSPATVLTNALGEASTKWTLGSVGANAASVTSGSLTAITLSATGTP